MKRVLPVLLFAPLFAAGCGGCGFPLNRDIEGTLLFDLGSLGDNCDGTDTVTNDNGTATWEHTAVSASDPPLCGMHTIWDGVLIDMATAKEEVDNGITEAGANPDDVTILFTGMEWEIKEVKIVDANGADVTPPTIDNYHGTVTLDGQTDPFVTIDHQAPADQTHPTVTLGDTQPVLDAVNAAYASGDKVMGDSDSVAEVDLAQATALNAATDPVLWVSYVVHVEATVGF